MVVWPISRLPAWLISTLPNGRLAGLMRVDLAARPLSYVATMLLDHLAN